MLLKTSAEWSKLKKVIVLDPDGWDRVDYEYSFEQELISEEEFDKRLYTSTILLNC